MSVCQYIVLDLVSATKKGINAKDRNENDVVIFLDVTAFTADYQAASSLLDV